MTTRDSFYYAAGREYGFRVAYMARAHAMPESSPSRRTLVRLARNANHERLRYLMAARIESTSGDGRE